MVGVPSPHIAIGTSAIAVAASAAANLVGHARANTVKWPCALVFALSGIAGAAGGAQLGKMVDGSRLLMLFGVLMVVVGVTDAAAAQIGRQSGRQAHAREHAEAVAAADRHRLCGRRAVGLLRHRRRLSDRAGTDGRHRHAADQRHRLFAGLGHRLRADHGGELCLVRPDRLAAWPFLFIVGGALGGLLGIRLAHHLAGYKHALTLTFSGIVIAVGLYVIARSILA